MSKKLTAIRNVLKKKASGNLCKPDLFEYREEDELVSNIDSTINQDVLFAKWTL